MLGAAALIGSRLRVATERAFGAGRAILPTPARVMPQVARKRWGEAALRLDVVGRDVVSALAEQAGRIADVAGGSLARAPFVLHTVEQVVDGVQRQIIDIILPEVIDRLVANPEQIRVIIHGQSVGMAEEFARSARGRAYEGDEAVNRFLSRMLHRDRSQLDTPEAVSRDVTTATQPAQ